MTRPQISCASFKKILDILFEGLIVAACLLDELPILCPTFLQILDLVVQLQQRAQLGDLGDLRPNLFGLSLFLEIGLFAVCLARHRIIYNLYVIDA